jgi:two-component system, sporulation sensor kinase E
MRLSGDRVMRKFIQRALAKLPKLDQEQIRHLLVAVAGENELLEVVLDSMTDGVLVSDSDHRLILYNKSSERLLPFTSPDPDEKAVWNVINDREIKEFLKETLLAGERVEDVEFTLEQAGEMKTLSFNLMPVVKDGTIEGTLAIVTDITERRKKEARLRRAENLASLTTLAAGVAHEIKNPLGSLGIHIQLMQRALAKEGCLDADYAQSYLNVLDEEVTRLNGIVVDFLFAVRPMNTELKSADVNAVIHDLLEFTKYELAEDGIEIVEDFEQNIPKVELDEKYLKQALLNIIKNAQAAMPDGGTLTVITEKKDDTIAIIIMDSGLGISDTVKDKIFEPYFTTKEFGSGLGLTVVYKIIKEHGGEISLRSREGVGTRFTITLPLPQHERRLLDFQGE